MTFETLKAIDIFKVPVNTFYTSRDKKLNKKSFHTFHGSKAGGCLSVIFVFVLFFLTQLKVIKMFSGELDVTRQERLSNPMDTPENSIVQIFNSSFTASLEMLPLDPKIVKEFDIFNNANANAIDDADFDLDKLKKYIEIELWIEDRSKGDAKFYLTPFKKCSLDDIKTTKKQKKSE